MILPKCAICRSKTPKFIKQEEPKGLLSNLGIKTALSKFPIFCFECNSNANYKMNDIVNNFLLPGG